MVGLLLSCWWILKLLEISHQPSLKLVISFVGMRIRWPTLLLGVCFIYSNVGLNFCIIKLISCFFPQPFDVLDSLLVFSHIDLLHIPYPLECTLTFLLLLIFLRVLLLLLLLVIPVFIRIPEAWRIHRSFGEFHLLLLKILKD